MRRCLLILLLLVSACGGDEEPPPEPPPLEDPDVPTPPPDYANPTLDVVSGQVPLPEGVEVATPPPPPPPEPTSAPAPAPEADDPHPAVELGGLVVTEAVAAARIIDRKPEGRSPFPDGSEVNIFTRIDNPGGHVRTIRHQWHYGGSRRSNVALKVKGTTWRTWSTRAVYGTGAWRVDIVDEAGTVLKSVSFTVE